MPMNTPTPIETEIEWWRSLLAASEPLATFLESLANDSLSSHITPEHSLRTIRSIVRQVREEAIENAAWLTSRQQEATSRPSGAPSRPSESSTARGQGR